MAKVKYKHGRVGVKNFKPRRPLAEEQRTEARRFGKEEGYKLGREAEKREIDIFLASLVNCRTIREVKRRITQYGQA